MPIVKYGGIQSATLRWKVKPLFHEEIEGLIKPLDAKDVNFADGTGQHSPTSKFIAFFP